MSKVKILCKIYCSNSFKFFISNESNCCCSKLSFIFPKIPKKWENKILDDRWKQLFKIKQEANVAIEEKRASKEIGSSLEAELTIITDDKNFELLEGIDLAEYFITSKAEKIKSKNKEELKIKVTKSKGIKCPRCWKILDNKCFRCEKVVAEKISV